MTNTQFQAAVALASTKAELNEDDTVLHGYGLPDFRPIVTTLGVVARMLRWQCQMLNGQWDSEALTECRNLFRHRVTVV